MQLSSSIVAIYGKEVEAVGWTQLTLLPYVVVSFVISINQSNWLDDERSPSICHQFDDKGPPSVCHQVFREAGSITKSLMDTHLQYVIRLASNGLMAKE